MWKWLNHPERTNRFQKTLDRDAEERFERIMRERGQQIPRGNYYPYFHNPPVYVVLLETTPDGSCEFAIENTPECEAILSFLSPVDAAIEGMLRARPGLRYDVRPALHIPEHYFLAANGELTLILHLAWLALDGRMLLRPSGMPCRFSRPLIKDAREDMPVQFEVDAAALDEVDYLHECAGLYAWEETHRGLVGRGEHAARFALRMGRPIQVTPAMDRSRCEFALFDPDGQHWHFVPQTVAQVE